MSTPHDDPHYSVVGEKGLARVVVGELRDGMAVDLEAYRMAVGQGEVDGSESKACSV
jgi:hypothetical protein